MRGIWLLVILSALLALCLAAGCESDNDDDDDEVADDESEDDDSGDDDLGDDDDGGPYYDPGWVVPMDVLDPVRDRSWARGIIHAHSIYSHDACDNKPEGNTECLMQLRQALCDTRQNYLMLTDHADSFAEHEFPDVLLYLPEYGDRLVYDDEDRPAANLIHCADGSSVTVAVGTENDFMPVHMHQHLDGTVQERYALYDARDSASAEQLRALGASLIVNHPEGWSIDELKTLAPDGVELFNLHAAIDPDNRADLGLPGLDFVDDLLIFLLDPLTPHPNLAIMTFWPQTQAWNERWDALLGVQRCYAVAATDVHRNALPFPLSDGERADGYRRMMQFFSNYLLVDDQQLASYEDALDSGRMLSVFEFLGFPIGFDFRAQDAKGVYEMGQEVPWSEGLTISVSLPEPFYIDPNGPQPEVSLELVRIDELGSEVVASSDTQIEYQVEGPGVFRAVAHIVPLHLIPFLGTSPELFIRDYPWIYANPIYIR
ncbi:MAG: hypothetical protein P9M14_15080 [Candidatus Alcyoniella australis]|nr:hypothetical protein [Candidatus Alcyoniella australis]